MRKVLVLLTLSLLSCQAPPPGFKPVEYASEPKDDWIRASAVGSTLTPEGPTEAQRRAFAEDAAEVVAVRASAAGDDFYGSKLFDGFDFMLQPVDARNRAVKKLGHLTVVLYAFEMNTLSGQGPELMRWHVPASRLHAFWQTSLVDGAYRMKLAWTRRPDIAHVKMEVRFTTLDARTHTKLITPSSIDQPRYRWLEK